MLINSKNIAVILGRVFVISKIEEKPWRLTEQTDKNFSQIILLLQVLQWIFGNVLSQPHAIH